MGNLQLFQLYGAIERLTAHILVGVPHKATIRIELESAKDSIGSQVFGKKYSRLAGESIAIEPSRKVRELHSSEGKPLKGKGE